jgi:hypothetical protein
MHESIRALRSLACRLRKRLNRSEWAIRLLGMSVSEGAGDEPGLLLIQIDGLSRRQFESAMAEGRMPFLKHLRECGGYDLRTFYSGLPSTTPAVQAELFYGVRAGVPGFSFRNRKTSEIATMFEPHWARAFEERFAAQGEGLLEGGSSWSNIYSGGAAPDQSHFCVAWPGFGRTWRAGGILEGLLVALLHIPAMLRIAGLGSIELWIGLTETLRGVWRRQNPFLELGMLLSRMCVGVGLRELLAIGGKVDVTRGLPIVHLNFLGYDELAHRRGPGSRFAHWSLGGIDRAISGLHRAARGLGRRDYQVWIFSDHGQEETRSFIEEFPGGVQAAVKATLPGQAMPFAITAMGSVAHLYLAESMDDAGMSALARGLVAQGRLPGVLHRAGNGTITWYHAAGETPVPAGVAMCLTTHPEALRAEIARDIVYLCENENAGDLILLGWSPDGPAWSFPSERGAHAGFGPEETQGFFLAPSAAPLPEDATDFVRPLHLRSAALALLGSGGRSRGMRPCGRTATVRVSAPLKFLLANIRERLVKNR